MVSAEMGQRQNEESNQGRDGGKKGPSSRGRVGDGICFRLTKWGNLGEACVLLNINQNKDENASKLCAEQFPITVSFGSGRRFYA